MRYLILMAVLASGCASVTPTQPNPVDTRGPLPAATRPVYNLAGYPPAFKAGYVDGCETAKRSQWGWKDPARFESDKQYRQGWQDGHQICAAGR